MLRFRTMRSFDWLPERTRKNKTMRFVSRPHKAVADTLQWNDDSDNGK
jgi:hypothetical protein